MNKWPKHKPKTEARILLEYLRTINPVTKAIRRQILFSRSLDSRNCFHRK